MRHVTWRLYCRIDNAGKTASRMQVLSVYDLSRSEALRASERMRASSKYSNVVHNTRTIEQALSYVGGRLSYINHVMREEDIVEKAEDAESYGVLKEVEYDIEKFLRC